MPDVYSLRVGDPETVAGYTLVGRLGEGGQGIVFLGRDHAGQTVAVKLLHARLAGDPDARTRFVREIAAAKRVARFSTARVLDADVAGERPYVVTEYVDGPSLQRLVTEQGPRSAGALERLAVGTASALSAIHQAGIVHRDFKPANVLLGPDGPRVIDFGIARVLDSAATLTSHAVGTPAYMAPEQLSRGPIGPAADVFAWGATMVFAATGRSPFGADTVPAVIGRVLRAEPELSGVPGSLRDLVADCLAKDPALRPTVPQVLDRLLAGAPGAPGAPAPGPAPAPGRPAILPPGDTVLDGPPAATAPRSRRARWPIPVAAVLVAVAVAGAAVWVLGGTPKQFTTLTNGCAMVSSAAVRQWMPRPAAHSYSDGIEDKGEEIVANCSWDSTGEATSFQQLSISVSAQRDIPDSMDDNDPPKGLDRAKKIQGDDRRKYEGEARSTRTDGSGTSAFVHSYGRYTSLGGLGDEAFVASEHVRKADGSYDPEIAYVDVRWGNALIGVTYTSGEMSSGHVMTPTAEHVVRDRAVAAAHELLRYLSRCEACTR